MDRRGPFLHCLHRAGLAPGERLQREQQCEALRQAPHSGDLTRWKKPTTSVKPGGVTTRPSGHTEARLPTTGPGSDHPVKLAARRRSASLLA